MFETKSGLHFVFCAIIHHSRSLTPLSLKPLIYMDYITQKLNHLLLALYSARLSLIQYSIILRPDPHWPSLLLRIPPGQDLTCIFSLYGTLLIADYFLWSILNLFWICASFEGRERWNWDLFLAKSVFFSSINQVLPIFGYVRFVIDLQFFSILDCRLILMDDIM